LVHTVWEKEIVLIILRKPKNVYPAGIHLDAQFIPRTISSVWYECQRNLYSIDSQFFFIDMATVQKTLQALSTFDDTMVYTDLETRRSMTFSYIFKQIWKKKENSKIIWFSPKFTEIFTAIRFFFGIMKIRFVFKILATPKGLNPNTWDTIFGVSRKRNLTVP
jgi:hypothetical protein